MAQLTAADIKKHPFKYEKSAVSLATCPKNLIPEFAFIGRSNVGKSSLINRVTMQKDLAKTSKTPGRTQKINFFNLKERIRIVDLPGYGFAKGSKKTIHEWNYFTGEYLSQRECLKLIFLLIDSRHGIKENDDEIINIFSELQLPFQIILTKCDKTPKANLEKLLQNIQESLTNKYNYDRMPIITSSKSNIGLDNLRNEIIKQLHNKDGNH